MERLEFEPMGVSVTKQQKEWIQAFAHKRSQNLSSIIREAIELLREKEHAKEREGEGK